MSVAEFHSAFLLGKLHFHLNSHITFKEQDVVFLLFQNARKSSAQQAVMIHFDTSGRFYTVFLSNHYVTWSRKKIQRGQKIWPLFSERSQALGVGVHGIGKKGHWNYFNPEIYIAIWKSTWFFNSYLYTLSYAAILSSFCRLTCINLFYLFIYFSVCYKNDLLSVSVVDTVLLTH